LLYYGDEVGLAGAGDPDNRRFMPWSNISADQLFVRERVKKLTAVRNAHPALRRGSRRTIVANNDLWFFAVTAASDTVYVAINRGDSDQTINGLPGSPMVEALEGGTVTGTTATIPARQARVFVAK
jgi:glycosidase